MQRGPVDSLRPKQPAQPVVHFAHLPDRAIVFIAGGRRGEFAVCAMPRGLPTAGTYTWRWCCPRAANPLAGRWRFRYRPESLPSLPEAGIRDERDEKDGLRIGGGPGSSRYSIAPEPDTPFTLNVQTAVHANLFRLTLR